MKFYTRYQIKLVLRYGLLGSVLMLIAGIAFSQYYIILNLTFGFILGLMIGLIQLTIFDRYLKNFDFWKQLIIALFILDAFELILIFLFTPIAAFVGATKYENGISFFLESENLHSFYIVLLSISSFLIFYFHVEKIIGEKKLIYYLFNRYNLPINEHRIFMFLDLTNSTHLTEQMGNEKYYRFLADFINDLSEAVLECNAEIYQYVGDEIVFTWKMEEGIESNNCIKMFYAIKNLVNKKRRFYIDSYGTYPIFKAAVHHGYVINAQIGNLKNELIYSGDPLNTTARIEALCNKYESELLISGSLANKLHGPKYSFRSIGKLKLRGKKELINVQEVTLTD